MKEELFSISRLTADVLVAGGGPTGVPCAIAAARQGARVILCQNRPVLGGNASSEVRMHIVGANTGRKNIDGVLESRESGIIEEIRLENAFRNPQRSASMFDLLLFEKVKAEPNITLLLNTSVTGSKTADQRITEVEAIRPSTEERFLIQAKVVVDCTGDGALGASAGAPFMRGREDKQAFAESLALETADEKTLGSSLLFIGRRYDEPMRFIAPGWARKFSESDLRIRPHGLRPDGSGLEYGYWWIEWGGQLDTIRNDEDIRDELLAIIMGVWDHIKNGGDHGADNWALDWFGVVPGKRESRRFIGQHILTESDLWEARSFPDAIAYGGWPIDLHPPEGIDRPEESPCLQHRLPQLYEIPLRSCVARDHSNLMFAGRNFSATHVAFASTRVMATCAAIGEGVGIAAAYACEQGKEPSALSTDPAAIREIQQRILRADGYLIGKRDQGQGDLARHAAVSASSHQPGGEPENIFSGQTRSVHGEDGVLAEVPSWHRWISLDLPASIELHWPQPILCKNIEIVWDSGLHRYLTFTHSDEYFYSKKMVWGRGQPELSKAYTLEVLTATGWEMVAQQAENYQRRSQYALSEKSIRAIRVTVTESWGINHARMMALRVY